MKIVNSYVFLLREKNKYVKDKDGNYSLDLTKDVLYLLRRNFNAIEETLSLEELEHPSKCTEEKFRKVLRGVKTGTIVIKNKNVSVTFKISSADTTEYLDIELIGSKKTELIDVMQIFHNKITGENNVFQKDFIVITSYDSISDYYCNKIYSLLSRFERTLRKLLLIVYTAQFKKAYFEETTSKEIQEKAKKIIKNKNDDIRLQNYLYSLDFGTMKDLLFEKRWTSYDEKKLDKYLTKNKDLSKLSDSELREKMNSIKPSSDWEKLFCNKGIDTDFEKVIGEIGKLRNLVAHNKLFTKDDYLFLKELLEENIKVLNKAILVTEDEDFKRINDEKFNESLQIVKEVVSNSLNTITSSIKKLGQAFSNIKWPNDFNYKDDDSEG